MDAEISTILLAAGESRRMGRPKLLLPWGNTTVLGKVIASFAEGFKSAVSPEAGSRKSNWEIVVITGGDRPQVENLLKELAKEYPVRAVYNPEYAHSGMISSLKTGLQAIGPSVTAVLVGLGDQPQVRPETIREIRAAYIQTRARLVVPSFQQRRGHPWLVARSLWQEILELPAPTTPRQFLQKHADETTYVSADETTLQDLDTPEEYNRSRP